MSEFERPLTDDELDECERITDALDGNMDLQMNSGKPGERKKKTQDTISNKEWRDIQRELSAIKISKETLEKAERVHRELSNIHPCRMFRRIG